MTTKSGTPLSTLPGCDPPSSFSLGTLDVVEVKCLLIKLNTHTATGPDDFPSSTLKILADPISTNITRIMNVSIKQNSFPLSWKEANVAPVWKNKGSKSDAASYWPISVLPVLGRLLEKAAARQLAQYCEDNNIIPAQQFGFRAKSICEHALILATDSWMADIDSDYR